MNAEARPLFSVIMPSYNHSRYIRDAIESVLTQSVGDLELIIVDDCSSDDSPAIIRGYSEADRRVRASFHEQNQGISRTMNEAIGNARGEYITLFASDDLWLEDKLKIQSEILNIDNDVIVWSDGLVVDDEGRLTGQSFLELHNALQYKKNGCLLNELIQTNYIFGSSLAVKREALWEIPYDEGLKYLNDYKIMVEMADRHNFHYVDKPLACYRVHGSNLIFSTDEGWLRDRITLRKYFLDSYKKKLSRKEKAHLHREIGVSYWKLGMRCAGLYYALLASLYDWRSISIPGAGNKK